MPVFKDSPEATALQSALRDETFREDWTPQFWLGMRCCAGARTHGCARATCLAARLACRLRLGGLAAGHEPQDMEQLECRKVFNTVRVPLHTMVRPTHATLAGLYTGGLAASAPGWTDCSSQGQL